MSTQIDLQWVPQSQQLERHRVFVGTHKSTHFHSYAAQTHTEQLLLFASAAVDSDNMCFVPYV